MGNASPATAITFYAHRKAAKTDGDVTVAEAYKQGSDLCRMYSEMTARIRTQVMLVLFSYAIGLAVALTKGELVREHLPTIGLMSGTVLFLFALVLCVLNYHYSNAHNLIRDRCLVRLEKTMARAPGVMAPWESQQMARISPNGRMRVWTRISWWLPFIAAGVVGIVGTVYLMTAEFEPSSQQTPKAGEEVQQEPKNPQPHSLPDLVSSP